MRSLNVGNSFMGLSVVRQGIVECFLSETRDKRIWREGHTNMIVSSGHGRIGPNDPPIIGREELKLMKPVSYLINTARAVLVDMPALEEALQNGSIMGAAIDVFPKEPLTKEDAVVQLDNCTLTNHRGGDTLDSYERSPELLLEQLQEAVQTGHTKYMI